MSFTEEHSQYAMFLPLTDKNTIIVTAGHHFKSNCTMKTVQLCSHNYAHIYKEGFSNEQTICREQHHCYNYSSHYTRLKRQKPGHYYAFYDHKIEHMSLFFSTKLYNSAYLFRQALHTEIMQVRYSELFWKFPAEAQCEIMLRVNKTALKKEGAKLCKSVGGTLPIMTSKAEQDELMALLKFSFGIQPPYPLIYIGLIQHKVGRYLLNQTSLQIWKTNLVLLDQTKLIQ